MKKSFIPPVLVQKFILVDHGTYDNPCLILKMSIFPQGAMSLLMLVTDDVFFLINYMSFVQWLSVGMSIVALLYLRKTRPNMPRPIKVQ